MPSIGRGTDVCVVLTASPGALSILQVKLAFKIKRCRENRDYEILRTAVDECVRFSHACVQTPTHSLRTHCLSHSPFNQSLAHQPSQSFARVLPAHRHVDSRPIHSQGFAERHHFIVVYRGAGACAGAIPLFRRGL